MPDLSVPPQVTVLAECFNKNKNSDASTWLLVTSQRLRYLSSPVKVLLPQIPSNLNVLFQKIIMPPPPTYHPWKVFWYFALKILDFETPFFLRISIGLQWGEVGWMGFLRWATQFTAVSNTGVLHRMLLVIPVFQSVNDCEWVTIQLKTRSRSSISICFPILCKKRKFGIFMTAQWSSIKPKKSHLHCPYFLSNAIDISPSSAETSCNCLHPWQVCILSTLRPHASKCSSLGGCSSHCLPMESISVATLCPNFSKSGLISCNTCVGGRREISSYLIPGGTPYISCIGR